MTDSDDSMALSSISRRTMLRLGLLGPMAPNADADVSGADRILEIWQAWRQVNAELNARLRDWQRKEATLLRTVGLPHVRVPISTQPEPEMAYSPEQIDRLLEGSPRSAALRSTLHAAFAAHRDRWECAAASIGFEAAEAKIDAIQEEWDALTRVMGETPAGSFEGIAAKLLMVLTVGQTCPDDSEHPWPALRSVLSDLQRLAGITERTGNDDQQYRPGSSRGAA
jgi:hypothetical protein